MKLTSTPIMWKEDEEEKTKKSQILKTKNLPCLKILLKLPLEEKRMS